ECGHDAGPPSGVPIPTRSCRFRRGQGTAAGHGTAGHGRNCGGPPQDAAADRRVQRQGMERLRGPGMRRRRGPGGTPHTGGYVSTGGNRRTMRAGRNSWGGIMRFSFLPGLAGLLFAGVIAGQDARTLDAADLAEEAAAEGDVHVVDRTAPEAIEWLRRPGTEPVICPFRGIIPYNPGEIECGLIQVPENREVPGSRTIELLYVRIHATGRDDDGRAVEKRADPVIYLTGGPGMGADYYV